MFTDSRFKISSKFILIVFDNRLRHRPFNRILQRRLLQHNRRNEQNGHNGS